MDPYRALSDLELWQLVGVDPEALGVLFERHAGAVHRFCVWKTGNWSLADDLTSIVFLEAWKGGQQAKAVSGGSLKPWLLGVANNVARNSARSIRRYRAALSRLPAPRSDEDVAELVVGRAGADAEMRAARSALADLPDDERNVVLMVVWSDLSYEEAALALDIPVGTVRSRLSRARRNLLGSLAAAMGSSTEEES